jgi:hypothetical protein
VPQVRVVQCNILHGGWPYEIRGKQLFIQRSDGEVAAETNFSRLSYPPDSPASGDPGSEFARQMGESVQPDVIGMQEVESRDVGRLTQLLGPDWRNGPPLDGSGASCIFWNSATVAPDGDQEVAVVQNFVNPERKTIPIRALKQAFIHTESGKRFALVTGKSWYQGSVQDRQLRAANTRELARKGGFTTAVALDMSPPGSPAFNAMRPFVAKGIQPTCPAGIFTGRRDANGKVAAFVRDDHIFYYSPLLGARQASGIIQCNTGPFFGSDHLYVWADVLLP